MLDAIRTILIGGGYEVDVVADGLLNVRDPESGVLTRAVLEDNVLYVSVPCLTVPSDQLDIDCMWKMLAADNGISTSFFQLYEVPEKRTVISLNSFCKLQQLGEDDTDDILSCMGFLLADILQARQLLSDLLRVST